MEVVEYTLGKVGRKALRVIKRLTIVSRPILAVCADFISATQPTGSIDRLSSRLLTSPVSPVYLKENVYDSSTLSGASLSTRMVNWTASSTFLLKASKMPVS